MSFYRRFIARFEQKERPLHEIAGPRGEFEWTDVYDKVFEELRRAVTSASMLAQPRLERKVGVHTGALATAVRAVLSQ